MTVPNCPEYDLLAAAVEQILRDLSEKTSLHLELFRSKQHERFMQLDKELELLVGEKERAIGSLRQHAKITSARQSLPEYQTARKPRTYLDYRIYLMRAPSDNC